MTGLTRSQIYKWNWDMRKRSGVEISELSNQWRTSEESEPIKQKPKDPRQPVKSNKTKIKPSIDSAFKLYRPTESLTFDQGSLSKLKPHWNLPSLPENQSQPIQRKLSQRFNPTLSAQPNFQSFLPPLTSRTPQAHHSISFSQSIQPTYRHSTQSVCRSLKGPDITPYIKEKPRAVSLRKQRTKKLPPKRTETRLSALEKKFKQLHLDQNSPFSGVTTLTFTESSQFHSNEEYSPLPRAKNPGVKFGENNDEMVKYMSVDASLNFQNNEGNSPNKREGHKHEKNKVGQTDEMLNSLQAQMMERENVIEECDDDESVLNHRISKKLLIQRKYSMMIDDDVRSIPQIILEKKDEDDNEMDYLDTRQRSNSLGHLSSSQTKDFLDKFLLEDQSHVSDKSIALKPKIITPQGPQDDSHSSFQAGYGRYKSGLSASFNYRTISHRPKGNLAPLVGRTQTVSSGQTSLFNRKFFNKRERNGLLSSTDRQSSGSSWRQALKMRAAGMGLDIKSLRGGSGSFKEEKQALLGDLSAQARLIDSGVNLVDDQSFIYSKKGTRTTFDSFKMQRDQGADSFYFTKSKLMNS